jgi:rhodanese-related sulfurtransferase
MSLIHCIALTSILIAAQDRTPVEFTKDSLQVVAENVAQKKAVLVDVRSQSEWNKGHLEGSIFLPVASLGKNVDPKMLAKKLPKDKILYTFCVVGVRAKAAAKVLQQHGYTVRALKPGYDDLIAAGFKKDTTEPSKATAKNEDTRQRNAG